MTILNFDRIVGFTRVFLEKLSTKQKMANINESRQREMFKIFYDSFRVVKEHAFGI